MCFGSDGGADTGEYDEPQDPRVYTEEGQRNAIPGVDNTGLGLSTAENAMGFVGSLFGERATDQQMRTLSNQNRAIEQGRANFRDARGNLRSTKDYTDPTREASDFAMALNRPPSIGLFGTAGGLAPFPANIPGRFIGGMIDDRLGTKATLGSSGNIRFGN